MTDMVKTEKQDNAQHCSSKQVPSHLGTISKLPEHGGGSEVVVAGLAAVEVAGSEEEEAERMACAIITTPGHPGSFNRAQRGPTSKELKARGSYRS